MRQSVFCVTKPETGFVPMFAAAAFFCASRKFFIASPGNPAAANAGKSGPSPPVCVNSCPGQRNTGFRKWKLCARIFHKFLDFIKIRFPVKAVLRKKPLCRPFRTASRTSAKLPSASAVLIRGAAYAWDSQKI
ncbi:MAG: hypothetical protein C6P37_12925 [Caldibacillus debilis]|uniref:Uncharacterized protein n=1 Tax=Caldibacillus debilis TaxID=301148 RepID=A0A3E0K1Z4_9BACI|nr:MAG: hypothetical protein C6P37_12925 [Caldibacillus debilis]